MWPRNRRVETCLKALNLSLRVEWKNVPTRVSSAKLGQRRARTSFWCKDDSARTAMERQVDLEITVRGVGHLWSQKSTMPPLAFWCTYQVSICIVFGSPKHINVRVSAFSLWLGSSGAFFFFYEVPWLLYRWQPARMPSGNGRMQLTSKPRSCALRDWAMVWEIRVTKWNHHNCKEGMDYGHN